MLNNSLWKFLKTPSGPIVVALIVLGIILTVSPPKTITQTITGFLTDSCSTLQNLLNDSFDTTCESSKYDPRADFNKDKRINITDFSLFRTNSGNPTWCQAQLESTQNPCACEQLYKVVRASMGGVCGQTKYTKVADINKDERVNITDFSLLRSHYPDDDDWC